MKKEKGILSMAFSFILNNVLAVVISLLIMTLAGFILKTGFAWIVQTISAIIFAFLFYHQAWHYGNVDVDNNSENRWRKVLIAGLVSSAPTFVLAVLSVLTQMQFFSIEYIISVFRLWSHSFWIVFDYLASVPLLYFLPGTVMLVSIMLGYVFGYKQIKISDYLYYARDKEE